MLLFSFDDTLDNTTDYVKYLNPWMIRLTTNKTSAAASLDYARGFPMVHNKGPNIGEASIPIPDCALADASSRR
jgi:hypothetical protein